TGSSTIKYSSGGVPLWTNGASGIAMAVDGIGNVFVMESSATIACSGAGAPLWTNYYYFGAAIAVDASGNVIVTGTSWNDNFDYYTAKYAAADGALLWEQHYNGPANGYDHASAVAVDGSGNVIVTGRTGGPDPNIVDGHYYTAKYAAADGTLLWEKLYNGPANLTDSATMLAVDASGNVLVTGYVDGPPIAFSHVGGDYYTAKYAAADGATLWEKRFNRPWSGGPSPCLALGPNGMIVVSGTSSDEYATVVLRDVPAVSIDLVPTGVHLRVTGLPGRSCNIERAPAITGPWSTINTQTAPASGLFEYLDTLPQPGFGFYRIVQP
ncbi:MAG TPA: PQQ-binding-like beta-propeller repeat protein, partial [Verrucomicrobiae bacterium]|nr:PQQ-binding-like beta-propeller repeat protein [Verrucomicrobiae bacterium]